MLARVQLAQLLLLPADANTVTQQLSWSLTLPDAPVTRTPRPPAPPRASALVSGPRLHVLPRRTRLHKAIVARALVRLAKTPAAQRIPEQEQGCFAQMVELLEALSVRRQWKQIPFFLKLARRARLPRPEQRHRLIYYRALVAVRSNAAKKGRRLLEALIRSPQVSATVRMLAQNLMGTVWLFETKYGQALDSFERAATAARVLGNREYEGQALLNASIVRNELGDYEEASALVQRSLELFRQHGNIYRETHALVELGNNALYLGRWHEAREHFRQTQRRYQELKMRHGLASGAWHEGVLSHMLGEPQASERSYAFCLELAQASGDDVMQMDTHAYRGLLYQSEGRYSEALDEYSRALRFARELESAHNMVLISYRVGTMHEQRGELDAALECYARAIDALERLRYTQESVLVKLGLLETTVQLYEAMVRLCLALGRDEDAFNYAERARSRAFLDTLAQHAPEEADVQQEDQPPLTAADIKRRLPPDAALIAYFTIGVLPRGERMVTNLPEENRALRRLLVHKPQLLIFALTDTELHVHKAIIDPNDLWPPGDHNPSASRFVEFDLPDSLHAMLVEPVAQLCAGRRVLHLIPHGPLHHLPFAALRDGGGQSLIEHSALTVAPSATVLLRGRRTRPNALRRGLALGYNDARHGIECAETEAALVAGLMGGEYQGGADINLHRLFEQGPLLDWLHICGHAEIDHRDPMKTALVLGESARLSGDLIMDRLRLDGAHVVLSACTTGLSRVRPGDELFGIPRALLHAGASTVVCTLWDTEDCVALWVMDRYYQGLRHGLPPAQALRVAQLAVQRLTGRELAVMLDRLDATLPEVPGILRAAAEDPDGQPFADPTSWAPFVLVGRD
ncbi:MAG TPA: CHAT domain-containing tetratricopeptide repeat protein [Roseiflexaceae bacterium]|nr:CHAT domain-containing tetratricopeptide repeat protein [Roseiflexaceae bacterium]